MTRRYLEDLAEGEHLPCRPVPMTREAIVDFARKFDPQPFHVDEEAASASVFAGLVASSLHTLSACTRTVVEARWAGLKRSRSRPDRGIAGIRCRVANQKGEAVLEYGYRYLVACRNAS